MVTKPHKVLRRGIVLERRIERCFTQLNAVYPGIFCIRLEVKQVMPGGRRVWAQKQPCDYLVITKQAMYAFDAKECAAKRWYPRRGAKPHQIDALLKLRSLGVRTAFVVEFTSLRGLPGNTRWIEDFASPASPESGVAFGWEMFVGSGQQSKNIAPPLRG
jgi:hypothetical protein